MSPTKLDIGGTIRSFRTARGLSTTALAQKVGISQAQISRLETNQQGFRSGTLLKIAKVLKVKPWSLYMTADERRAADRTLKVSL